MVGEIVTGASAPEPVDPDRVVDLRHYLLGIVDCVYGDPVDMPDRRQAELVIGRLLDGFEKYLAIRPSTSYDTNADNAPLDLSWLGHLPADSLARFLEEFKAAVMFSEWSALNQMLHEWRGTALIRADPELYARLKRPEQVGL